MAPHPAPDGQTPSQSARRFETTATQPADIGRARHLITEHLRRWRCADPDDATLVLSELVTNAVIHAGGAVKIAVTHERDQVHIEVHDNRSEPPHLRQPGAAPGGRGLHIVDRISDRWGSRATPTGKLVWAVIACPEETTALPGG